MPPTLPKPINFLFAKGGYRAAKSPVFRVLGWQLGSVSITPKSTGAAQEISVLRLHVERLDKPSPVRYYDISSRKLHAQFFGYLETGAFVGREFSVYARGFKPSKQFSLRSTPPSAG